MLIEESLIAFIRLAHWRRIGIIFAVCTMAGCGILKKKEPDPTFAFISRPLTPRQSEKLTNEVGGNFLYGQGFGELLLNIGGILITPWYAVYVLGNGIISLAGYEPPYVTKLLPPKTESGYNEFYDGVTSGPGRVAGAIAGQKYRTPEVIKERYQRILEKFDKENSVDAKLPNSDMKKP